MPKSSPVGSWNPIVNLAREHLQMRKMIEEAQSGFAITPTAWVEKYKDFICAPRVEMYVNDVLRAEEMFTPPPQRSQH